MEIARRKILIATSNPGKLREIQQMTEGMSIDWLALSDIEPIDPPVEDRQTFAGNAAKKARYYSRHSGLWTLADDSGLEVDALDGAPGVHSARYAGDDASDADNNAKLIKALAGVPDQRRTARFRCAMALANGRKMPLSTEGEIEGQIIDEPRGENGFGYDPHFFSIEHGCTTAEMPAEIKNQVSHRGQALRSMLEDLKRFIQFQEFTRRTHE